MASKYGDWTRGEDEALLNIIGAAGGGDGAVVARRALQGRARIQIVVENFFQKVENFTIPIPALPRPTLEELRVRFDWIKVIESDSSPTEAISMELGTVLRTEEPSIKGKEYEFRLGSDSYLGLQHALWLVGHQDELPEFKALRGKIYIDFPGLKIVASDGGRNFPYLRDDGLRWFLNWFRFDYDFSRRDRVARPCK